MVNLNSRIPDSVSFAKKIFVTLVTNVVYFEKWSILRRFLEVKRRRVLSSARKGIKIAIIVLKNDNFCHRLEIKMAENDILRHLGGQFA